ncbi:carboxy terminal-processing peptidase [Cellvibrio polysaccharolyticus]|uniref:Tail-specific protease n=1 Tax=Cellvibrio polysaccharolyticus TaxID=2082724 RepID=A0A928V1Z3_9GAMM|nr:carboxy terminal-processing peptidase [Cellvibrio polysaccharolyticus]MBE8717293.1 tail-specific protease [Cellvibrio polysaccharolyticus]
MHIALSKHLTFSLVLSLLLSVSASHAEKPTPLKYTPEQAKTTIEIVKQLDTKHYRTQEFNDDLSSRFLDDYLKALDPTKNFFLKSDIDAFEKYRHSFDDDLKKGKLDKTFEIYNRFNERMTHRLEIVAAQLEDTEVKYDFDVDESIPVDWEEAEWPANEKAADALWQKRIKANLLGMILNGKTLEESRTTLFKRYSNQLRRMQKQDAEEAYSIMMNSLTMLYDPHTNYLSPRTSENFNINMALSLEGIGAVLQGEDEYTKVMRLVPAGPADKQGELKPTDRIIAIGQGTEGEMVDVVGWRLDEVVDLVRGKKGTIVKLEVLPANDGPSKVISIKRETVKLEEQAARKHVFDVSDGQHVYKVGVINIPTFYMDFEAYRNRDPNYKSTTRDVFNLIAEMSKENVEGIIVDLRANGGGSLQEAASLTDLFIDPGPVVQIRHANGVISRNYRSFSPAMYRGPIVVLIDRLSASASEIFAGAIQDYGRGLIIGTQSFGKGSVQSIMSLPHGDMKITESKFYRISGDSTQHRGVIPDVELPSLIDTEKVGESSTLNRNALPWDHIHAVPHDKYFDIQALLPEINKSHNERLKTDPDFIFLRAQMAIAEEANSRKFISLRESTRRAEQEKFEQQALKIENQRRTAKGLEVYKSYEEIKEGDEEEEAEAQSAEARKIDPAKDPFLQEAGQVLASFITELKKEDQPARVANF